MVNPAALCGSNDHSSPQLATARGWDAVMWTLPRLTDHSYILITCSAAPITITHHNLQFGASNSKCFHKTMNKITECSRELS